MIKISKISMKIRYYSIDMECSKDSLIVSIRLDWHLRSQLYHTVKPHKWGNFGISLFISYKLTSINGDGGLNFSEIISPYKITSISGDLSIFSPKNVNCCAC